MPGPTFLDGETVALCPATADDLPFLLETWNSPEVRATRSDLYPRGPADLEEYLGGTVGRREESLALLVCADGDPVGLVMLVREQPRAVEFRRGELAFWTAPEEWGQGYATAGAALLLDHAFDRLGLHRVSAEVYDTNDASARVMEKLGFRREGVDREAAFADGWVDLRRYGLLDGEWEGADAVPVTAGN